MRDLALVAGIIISFVGVQVQAATALPKVINNTKSLQVGRLEANRKEYKLPLRNTSQVALAGVAVLVVGSNGVCDVHTIRAAHGALIPPSEASELEMDVAKSKPKWFGPGGESCSDSAPETLHEKDKLRGSSGIIITAADFEDGTYEGDSLNATMMESIRLGNETERARIAAFLEEELQNGQSRDSQKIDSIRIKVESLPEEPEPALVRATMDRFPFLPATVSASIQRDLQAGLRWQKTLFLNNLKLYLLYQSRGAVPRVSLQQWWYGTKGQCDLPVPLYCEESR